MGVNRPSACRESFVVCIVGKMAKDVGIDGIKLLWCHCHLVWLVFKGSIPTFACFHSENFFVTCSCCLNGKREETWEGRQRGRRILCTV